MPEQRNKTQPAADTKARSPQCLTRMRSDKPKRAESIARELGRASTTGGLVERLERVFAACDLRYGHGTENADDEAYALVFAALELDFAAADAVWGRPLPPGAIDTVARIAARRVNERLPLPYLTGEAWFAGLRFKADRRALVPRSPIAELIMRRYSPWITPRQTDDNGRGLRVLDMCTGNGCIAIATAVYVADARVDAVDISAPALALARDNIELHGVAWRVKIIQSDMFAALESRRYDLIVSNPPYVAAGEMAGLPLEYRHEPRLALQAGAGGLDFIDRLLREGSRYLADDGVMIVEAGTSGQALRRRYPRMPFIWIEFEHGGGGVFALNRRDLPQPRD